MTTTLLDTIFGDSLTAPAPWPGIGQRKHQRTYDADLVWLVITDPDKQRLREFDPADLRANQPSVIRDGVAYYLTDRYRVTGKTYADFNKPSNRLPFLYLRDDGSNLILAGHHRAAAALLTGQPLVALWIEGPWGKQR